MPGALFLLPKLLAEPTRAWAAHRPRAAGRHDALAPAQRLPQHRSGDADALCAADPAGAGHRRREGSARAAGIQQRRLRARAYTALARRDRGYLLPPPPPPPPPAPSAHIEDAPLRGVQSGGAA